MEQMTTTTPPEPRKTAEAVLKRLIRADYGMCDARDNDGQWYQSADLAATLVAARQALAALSAAPVPSPASDEAEARECKSSAVIGEDRNRLLQALYDAKLQLTYLDERWPTGTTPATVARIQAALDNALPWATIESALSRPPAASVGVSREALGDLPEAFERWWATSKYSDRYLIGYSDKKCLAFAAFEAAAMLSASPLVGEG
jgi:hypothetical protein